MFLIPFTHLVLLECLLELLSRISKKSDTNQMSSSNLARVFAPNLLRPKPTVIQSLEDYDKSANIIEFMIDNLIEFSLTSEKLQPFLCLDLDSLKAPDSSDLLSNSNSLANSFVLHDEVSIVSDNISIVNNVSSGNNLQKKTSVNREVSIVSVNRSRSLNVKSNLKIMDKPKRSKSNDPEFKDVLTLKESDVLNLGLKDSDSVSVKSASSQVHVVELRSSASEVIRASRSVSRSGSNEVIRRSSVKRVESADSSRKKSLKKDDGAKKVVLAKEN